MVVIWGTTHAGKVDQVPGGMFHVVTRFGHVYYVPLFPTASFLVLEETPDGGFQGAQIPFSFKSALAGWMRGFGIVGLIVGGIWMAIALLDPKVAPFAWVTPLLIGLGSIAALVCSYKLKFFTEATYERAKELAQHIGLNDMGELMLEVAYGRISAAEAEAELARREQQMPVVAAEAVPESPLEYPPMAGAQGGM
jgi:hypothetical protein